MLVACGSNGATEDIIDRNRYRCVGEPDLDEGDAGAGPDRQLGCRRR